MSGYGYRMRHSFRENRLAQSGCPAWESTDKVSGSNCTTSGQACQQYFDPCYCPADSSFPEAYMVYPGYFEYTCTNNNGQLTWTNEFGVDGACSPSCSDTPLCDPGQNAYTLPQSGVSATPSGKITCGTNVSNCYICAPPGPITFPSGSSATVNISVHCTANAKSATYFSAVESNSATITKSNFGGVPQDLIVTVTAKNNDSGTVRYEWCDNNNHYGTWYETWQATPTNVAPVTQTCASGQQSFFLPQSSSQIPTDVGAPTLSCANNGASTCQICAPTNPITKSGSFTVSILCSKSSWSANWKSYSSTLKISGTFNKVSPQNFTATVSGQGSGWARVEWCDSNNKYGSWISDIKL